MAMSGIVVDPAIAELYNNMKLRHTHKWATFMISANKKSIVEDQVGEPCSTDNKDDDKKQFSLMVQNLGTEPRYILYDFSFTNKESRLINKLAFIFWCNDDAKIGSKMLYASSKDSIKKAFTGLGMEFQANDMSDLDYSVMAAEIEKKS